MASISVASCSSAGGPPTLPPAPSVATVAALAGGSHSDCNNSLGLLAPPKLPARGSTASTPDYRGKLVRRRKSSPFSKWSSSLNGLDATKKLAGGQSKFYLGEDDNVKRVLEAVASDQLICTNPYQKRKRRTVMLQRSPDEKFGFTIQTYTFGRRNRSHPPLGPAPSNSSECSMDASCTLEQVTYVDYVEMESAAGTAGLRAGDVIVAINGAPVTGRSHEHLVSQIAACTHMRMVVLFENCVQKVDLCSRAIQLKRLLRDKEQELHALQMEEQRILQRVNVVNVDGHSDDNSQRDTFTRL